VTTATEIGDEVENTATADSDQLGDSSANIPTVLPTEESATVVPKGFLILFTTTPNRFSYRGREAGSWLPAEMKKAIEKEKRKENEKRKMELLMFQGQRSCRRHWLHRRR